MQLSGATWLDQLDQGDGALEEAMRIAAGEDALPAQEGTDFAPEDRLLVLAFRTFRLQSGKLGCTVLISTRALLRAAQRLANLQYLKIAVDATFKDLFGQWKLLPLGFLSKQLGPTTFENG